MEKTLANLFRVSFFLNHNVKKAWARWKAWGCRSFSSFWTASTFFVRSLTAVFISISSLRRRFRVFLFYLRLEMLNSKSCAKRHNVIMKARGIRIYTIVILVNRCRNSAFTVPIQLFCERTALIMTKFKRGFTVIFHWRSSAWLLFPLLTIVI